MARGINPTKLHRRADRVIWDLIGAVARTGNTLVHDPDDQEGAAFEAIEAAIHEALIREIHDRGLAR